MKQNLLSIQIDSKSASESGLDCKISTAFCTSHDACVLLLPKFSNHLFDKGLSVFADLSENHNFLSLFYSEFASDHHVTIVT